MQIPTLGLLDSPEIAYIALFGRVILLGYERIVVKKLGDRASSISGSFIFFFIASLFLFPFVILSEPEFSNLSFLKLAVLSSFVYSFAFWLYVKSLSSEEASLVSPLYNFNVFFLLFLTIIFLDESITPLKVIGLGMLVYGASFLKRDGSGNFVTTIKLLFKNKGCQLMLTSSFLIAVGRTIDGFVVKEISPILYAFSIYLGISMFLLFYHIPGNQFKNTLKLFKNKTGLSILSGAVNAFSYLFLLFAFTEVEVSVAEPVSILSILVTVVLAGKIFKENIKERIIGVLVMIGGAYLLFI